MLTCFRTSASDRELGSSVYHGIGGRLVMLETRMLLFCILQL